MALEPSWTEQLSSSCRSSDHRHKTVHSPSFESISPALDLQLYVLFERLPAAAKGVSVCDYQLLDSLLLREYNEIVELNGNYQAMYRIFGILERPGDFSHRCPSFRRFNNSPIIRSANIYSPSRQSVYDASQEFQGLWACFPNCNSGDYVEALWKWSVSAPPNAPGHFCRSWPDDNPVACVKSLYRIAAHPNLQLISKPSLQAIPMSAGWRLFEASKLAISTFNSWEQVGYFLSEYLCKLYQDQWPLLQDLGAQLTEGETDAVKAVHKYLNYLERETPDSLYAKYPGEVVEDQSGTFLDLAVLGCGLLKTLQTHAELVLHAKREADLDVPGLWFDSASIRCGELWIDPASKKLGLNSSRSGRYALICNIFGSGAGYLTKLNE